MTITRSAKAINEAKDFLGNVDIKLTEEEMFQIYYAVKRFFLMKDVECILNTAVEDAEDNGNCLGGLSWHNSNSYAEQIVDDVERKVSENEYLGSEEHEAVYDAVQEAMKNKFDIYI